MQDSAIRSHGTCCAATISSAGRQAGREVASRATASLWPTAVSDLERGLRRDHELASAYRDWLAAARLLWGMAADLSAGNR
ncbi:hypothetical protein [Streptomyces griseoaurantiacus]|uniref:hypothetical protein n=1 Tax=Streptomyces griseoaurantiacus TaxID=68213 RepID=UPI00367561A7